MTFYFLFIIEQLATPVWAI